MRLGSVLTLWAAFAVTLTGCMSDPVKLPVSRDTPFVLNEPVSDVPVPITRSQKPDAQPPIASSAPSIQTVSQARPGEMPPNVRVRAWVNGKPIFDDELKFAAGPLLRRIYDSVPPAQRDAEVEKALKLALDAIIESELLVQDAFRRLEKSPKRVELIKADASEKADRQIDEIRRATKAGNLEEFKQIVLQQGLTLEGMRRSQERDFVANGYLRQLVKDAVDKIGHKEVHEYYEQHKNEYMQVDRVKWQNIFIAVGPKHPTMDDAKQFAQQVLQSWAGGEDIAKLLEFDDGLAASSKGAGAGEIKGSIRPQELEPYLFAMKEGEFGPLVPISTGVHIFRLLKRENAGYTPFDEKTQIVVGSKLKNETAERERTFIMRKLRDQADIVIER